MKKIIISILLITSLPLIGSTDNPQKQLSWTEKGTILRKHLYKYAFPTVIITYSLSKSIEKPDEKYIQKVAIPCAIGTVILYPAIPYIVPIYLILPKFLTVYIPTVRASIDGLKALTNLYRGNKTTAARSARDTTFFISILYAMHKGFKEIQQKTAALHTCTQHGG